MSHRTIAQEQRVALATLLRTGMKQNEIARVLGYAPSSICRELQRNRSGRRYLMSVAQKRSDARRRRANFRFRKIETNLWLKRYIVNKLKRYWSPEQIAGRLRREHGSTVICHETIYCFLFSQRPDLKKFLRCQKGKYRLKYGSGKRCLERERNKKRRIDTRPVIVEKRERIGDWEGDTVMGAEKTKAILTHVDRKSGFLCGDKVEKFLAATIQELTVARFSFLPKIKKQTITYDNGTEFSAYELIERFTGMTIYFAYPYRSWERATNENTNGLLRQFFPKKSLFAHITQQQLDTVVRLINTRPRKRLNYLSPSEVFLKNCVPD